MASSSRSSQRGQEANSTPQVSVFEVSNLCATARVDAATDITLGVDAAQEIISALQSMQKDLGRLAVRQEDIFGELGKLTQGQDSMKGHLDEMRHVGTTHSRPERAAIKSLTIPMLEKGASRLTDSVTIDIHEYDSGRGGEPGLESSDTFRAGGASTGHQTSGSMGSAGASSEMCEVSRRMDGVRTDVASIASAQSEDESVDVDLEELTVELHDNWKQHQAFAKRMFTPSFDIFSRSAHTDLNQRSPFDLQLMMMHGLHSEAAFMTGKKMRSKRSLLQSMVMPPSSNFLLVWNLMELVLLTYDFLFVPALVYDLPQDSFMDVMQYIGLIFWSMDLPMSFLKGYITDKGELEMKLSRVAKQYVRHRSGFALDFTLLIIEYVTFTLMQILENARFARASRFMRMLRYTKSLKIGKMRRLIRRMLARVKSPGRLAICSTFGRLLALIGMCHCGACAWFYVSKTEDGEDGLYRTVKDLPRRLQYLQSLQLCVATMGYGYVNVFPMGFGEMLFSVAFSAASLVALTLWIGDVITSMLWLQDLNRNDREREMRMRDFLRDHEVSWDLRNRVWAVCSEGTNDHNSSETQVELIKRLPENMLLELRAEVFVPLVTLHPFFGFYSVSTNADRHAMYNLVKKEGLSYELVESDVEVFVEREPAVYMYIMARGVVSYRWKETTPRHEKEWLAEAALWLNWTHVGQAMATRQADIVMLHANIFRDVMKVELPEAHRYAIVFAKNARRLGERMNDITPVEEECKAMAEDVFAAMRVFDIARCKPADVDKHGRSEWWPFDDHVWQDLWKSPWSDANLLSSSALISTMTTEMKSDIILVFQTLFTEPPNRSVPWSSESEQLMYDRRILFLKRLFLCFALCGVSFTPMDNGFNRKPWPYPLASVICHGCRVLVQLSEVHPKELLNFLIFGKKDFWNWDKQGPPAPFYARHAASHGVVADPVTAQLREIKLKGASALSVTSGRSRHMGLDLPVGGMGNPSPQTEPRKLLVGPSGVPYSQRTSHSEAVFAREFQHGHLYARWDDFGQKPMWKIREAGAVDNSSSSKLAQDPFCTLQVSYVASLAREMEQQQGQHWKVVEQLSDVDMFKMELARGGVSDLLTQADRLSKLHRKVVDTHELALERVVDGRLRCRGLLVHLAIESDDNMIFTHVSAFHPEPLPDTYSVRSGISRRSIIHEQSQSPLTHNQNQRATDPHVLTVICRQHESWFSVVATALRAKFQLGESSVEKIMHGLQEQAVLSKSEPLPTVCHHHLDVCGGELHLEYDALFLRSRLSARDRLMLEPPGGDRLRTEEVAELDGFPVLAAPRLSTRSDDAQETQMGTVVREWKWMPKLSAVSEGVVGIAPTPRQPTQNLTLHKEMQNSASLLMGIENSAPLKDDLWGQTHGIDAKSKDISAFGKRKWRDYRKGGQEAPADLGGMHVCVTAENFVRLQELSEMLQLGAPSTSVLMNDVDRRNEQELFQKILQASDSQCDTVLREVADKMTGGARSRRETAAPMIHQLLCRIHSPTSAAPSSSPSSP